MRVLKWNVKVDDEKHPIGIGKVVHVACLESSGIVQVWTLEDAKAIDTFRWAQVIGTGMEVPEVEDYGFEHLPQPWDHVGSTVTAGGALVWHVFAEPL